MEKTSGFQSRKWVRRERQEPFEAGSGLVTHGTREKESEGREEVVDEVEGDDDLT